MRVWSVLPVLLASTACAETFSGNPDHLVDQSGAVFGLECDSERCRVTPTADTPPFPEGYCGPVLEPRYIHEEAGVLQITAACIDEAGLPVSLWGGSRFVVCEDDGDCPSIVQPGQDTLYVCDSGLCKDVTIHEDLSLPWPRWGVELLCIGDEPRFESYNPTPELTAALDAACPGDSPTNAPCTSVPPGCFDPFD